MVNPTSILDSNTSTRPLKSFIDVLADFSASQVPVKLVLLHHGESAVHFSTKEVQSIVEPCKLSLIGKSSFGHPTIDVIQNFFLSEVKRVVSGVSIG